MCMEFVDEDETFTGAAKYFPLLLLLLFLLSPSSYFSSELGLWAKVFYDNRQLASGGNDNRVSPITLLLFGEVHIVENFLQSR
ncbi:hypothetical protein KSP39_PZI001970 [Platanthera zijinensis]|uniref:Uncharacterized protein n=1 Tax=Platanthera zijinensis TaxID=2320716 RepID=A0AAP0BX93_9ASPA